MGSNGAAPPEQGLNDDYGDYWGPSEDGLGLVNAWWRLDMGVEETVFEVVIHSRAHERQRSGDVEVRVGNVDPVTAAVDGEPMK